MSWLIYKHTNKINGKVYIGQTKHEPERRWRRGGGYKNCHRFFAAINKYGWDNFDHTILESDIPTQHLATVRENYWIEQYKSLDPLFGYNICIPGKSVNIGPKGPKSIIELGTKINNWIIISEPILGKNSTYYYMCKCCVCGYEHAQTVTALHRRGCKKCANAKITKHGFSNGSTGLYSKWANMKACCYNTKNKCYSHIGAKGIKVCKQWLYNFKNFYDWSYANGYTDEKLSSGITKLVLVRKDLSKDFCPENCVFESMAENKSKFFKSQASTYKKVKCLETNVIYESAYDAAYKTSISDNNIRRVCRKNGINKTAGGYHWEYVD